MSSFAAMWSPLLFGFALFLSAALLFVVQPMLGRTLLPHLGGNPIAWNACLVFFQATLLASYLYADLVHRFRGLRWQPWLQLLLLALAIILCFAGFIGDPLLVDLAPRLTALESYPILSVICLLIVAIGLPFFALAAVSPLVQRWFAHLDHPKSSDPYFLFVASNLGGLTALIIYPLLIEPAAPLYAQWMSWKLAVTALGVLLLLVALCAWLSPRSPELEPVEKPSNPNAPLVPRLIGRGPATWPRCWYWFFAAALPVGLMMGATDYLTLDLAPTAILWTVPLALYLLAFGQSFARFSPFDHGNFAVRLAVHLLLGVCLIVAPVFLLLLAANADPRGNADQAFLAMAFCCFFGLLLLVPFAWLRVVQPLSVLGIVFMQTNLQAPPMEPIFAFAYLACFYLSARLCLGSLARDRPAAPALTAYYTWIGLGGLVGGLFQVLLAPLLFRRDYLEFSLLAALATMLRPAWLTNGVSDWILCSIVLPKKDTAEANPSSARRRIGIGFDFALALLTACLSACAFWLFRAKAWDTARLDLALGAVLLAVSMFCLRPLRFGLALAAVVCLTFIGMDVNPNEDVIVQQRNAFGILRVTEGTQEIRVKAADGGDQLPPRFTERRLMHGTTIRGTCITEPAEMNRYPTTFYHRKGPVGQVMRNLEWFPVPAKKLREGKADFWLQHNRDNAKDDARIAASLFGIMVAGGAGSMDLLAASWSEPPYAIVGLGTGTLFTYAHPCQQVDAYELDPAIIELSTKDPPTFHYYQSALKRGVNARIIPGDPRRNLARPGREGFYHVIFVDASPSAAIPIHLVTQEAIELYFQKLVPEGIVCFHTSNRYVDMASVVENIASKLNLASIALAGTPNSDDDDSSYSPSEWVVVARNHAVLHKWTLGDAFERRDVPLNRRAEPRFSLKLLWTDERSSLLSAERPGQGWTKMIYGMLITILFFSIFLGLIEVALSMMARRAVARPTSK
jgi:hypothetical protein